MVLRPPAVAPEQLACQRCALSQRPVSALQAWRRGASRAAAACSVVRPRRCRGCTRRATSISLALPSALWRGRRRRRSALLSLAPLGHVSLLSAVPHWRDRPPIAAGHPEQRDGRRRLHWPRLVRPTLQRSAEPHRCCRCPSKARRPEWPKRAPIVSAHDWALVPRARDCPTATGRRRRLR